MITDRPAMAKYVHKEDVIFEWAARKFGGEAIGEKIYWSKELPGCTWGCLGEHTPPFRGRPGVINIREKYASGQVSGASIPFEQLWCVAIFELYNISNTVKFEESAGLALEGKISREQWVKEIARGEFNTSRKTASFYRQTWLPWSRSKQFTSTPDYWYQNTPDSFEDWLKRYSDPKGYPYVYYAHYDKYIAPFVKKKKK